MDRIKGKTWIFSATSVILACGGAGGIYSLSTNSGDVTGDGYSLALRCRRRFKRYGIWVLKDSLPMLNRQEYGESYWSIINYP